VGAGEVAVPREPDAEVIDAMIEAWFGGPGGQISFEQRMMRVYAAMLAKGKS